MISIIIITKNEEKCLPRLLKSIKSQTFKDYEVIVSDANSEDKTRKIAKLFGCHIVDGGLPSKGRNNGAKVAKGDILLFLDADVALPKRFLELNLKEFKKRNMGCATVKYIPISKHLFDKTLYFIYNKFALIMQYFNPFVGGFCIFATKKVFDSSGGFNEKMLMSEDHVFIKDCLKHGRFGILNGCPILCDIRRLEKEGRFRLIRKYVYTGGYRIFFGDTEQVLVDYELQGNVKLKKGSKK